MPRPLWVLNISHNPPKDANITQHAVFIAGMSAGRPGAGNMMKWSLYKTAIVHLNITSHTLKQTHTDPSGQQYNTCRTYSSSSFQSTFTLFYLHKCSNVLYYLHAIVWNCLESVTFHYTIYFNTCSLQNLQGVPNLNQFNNLRAE